ncbi:MAG: phosphatase PAP2 family protein [Deltaproteobacteria bacterium]|nr:phosphatase PAP2 family protein [Deltaproteobacteria bacterium]
MAARSSDEAPFEPYALRNTSGWFLGGEVVVSLGMGFFMPDLILNPAPEDLTCADAWCETNGFDEALNPVFLAGNPKAAGTISHVFTIGLTPAVGLAGVIVPAALAGKGGYALQDSIIVLDAFVIATGFNSLAKMGGRRQRPAYHYGREAETEAEGHAGEEFVSFFSGDTTWAFALASSASTLAFLRGYPSARYIAIGTGVLALTGGILRMSADMHWATDVLVGAAVGTAVGIGLPLLVHGRKRPTAVALVPSFGETTGLALTGSW